MKQIDWTVVRRSTVIGERKNYPRPKIVTDVLMIGPKASCLDLIERLSKMPEHQSTLDIEIELKAIPYNGQKSGTSARPNNGRAKESQADYTVS
jgi:hypothetical protein